MNQVFYPRTPKIIQWAIKYSGGLVKDENQANYVLLGFVAAAIIIALALIFGGNKTYRLTPEEEKLFRGKSSSEKLLLPQKIDESLFSR